MLTAHQHAFMAQTGRTLPFSYVSIYTQGRFKILQYSTFQYTQQLFTMHHISNNMMNYEQLFVHIGYLQRNMTGNIHIK